MQKAWLWFARCWIERNRCACLRIFLHPALDAELSAATTKAKKGKFKPKKVKRKDAPEGAGSDSDSDIERENLDLFWEGKHRPCFREAWVVEKATLTKKEAERRVRQ